LDNFPSISSYVADVKVPPQKLDNEDFYERREKAKEDNEKRNLKAAHWYVGGILIAIGLSYIFVIWFSAYGKSGTKVEIPNEILSILQAALFTLLGFLFGEKNSKR